MRIGVDLGGTKIEALAMDDTGKELGRRRVPTPRGSYDATLEAIAGLVAALERELGRRGSVGIGMPGTISPATGLVKNANSTWLNGRRFAEDLTGRLGRSLRFANDANCFALSEAVDGAARGARVVFGAILGTGVGGGIVVEQRVIDGRHRIAGEWGHTPLPWMTDEEYPGPRCNCGRNGCIEQFLSGPAKNRERDRIGEDAAMARYEDRLARAFSMIINMLDPDVIVVGGGLSKHERLYASVPPLLKNHVYWKKPSTPIVHARHGDASGVRGAAMLWPA
jgi:fructokinase